MAKYEIGKIIDIVIKEMDENEKQLVSVNKENTQEFYYTTEPIIKKVTKKEFEDFIKNYPRKLTYDYTGISEPPAVSYNDFELANRWPYSVVANTWKYSDNPNDYYYETNPTFYIMENYKEVFNSKTGNVAE